jgi:hypothetical protein
MVPDCIDPTVGGWLREIMNQPIPETVGWCHHDFSELWDARLHWSGCPACRTEFAGALPVFKEIGAGLENRCRSALSWLRDKFLQKKNSFLTSANDLASAHTEVIIELAAAEQDVFNYVIQGQEVLSFGASNASRRGSEASLWSRGDTSLSYCRDCQDFISSLQPDVQQFVFAVACSRDLFIPVWEWMDSSVETGVFKYEDLWERMHTAITTSDLHPATLLSIIENASIGYSISSGGWPTGGVAMVGQKNSPPMMAQETLQDVRQEWKSDFDDMRDSLDSVKAGQMELMRRIEHNNRPAEAYEPYIVAQLGAPLYSRLQEKTQRALQLAEYFYHINHEPDGFSLTGLTMAQGYENELFIRIIWPFVSELLAAETPTYPAKGPSKGKPLILTGKYQEKRTLGDLGWYLKNDITMRDKVSALGFDVETISTDVALVSILRNEPAHNFSCDRAVADDLRRRILCSDGVLSRLHPEVATAAHALTA